MNNFIRKFKNFLIILFSAKFLFKNPPHKKIAIFDCESPECLKNFLNHYNCCVISTRVQKITEIYVSKKIISFIVKNFFKRSLKQNYLIILIKTINPRLVITYIDNSIDFYIISKHLENAIKFIAIQGANRETKWLPTSFTKKIFIPEYLCFANFDKKIYIKKKANVKKFSTLGSLKVSLALSYAKSKKIKINKNRYHICLIGEHDKIWSEENESQNDNKEISAVPKKVGYSTGTHAEYTLRFCKKYNLKLIIPGSTKKGTKGREDEINFYRHYLKTNNFSIQPNEPNKFSSYLSIMQSQLIIGLNSTLLREAMALDKKVLACNFTGSNVTDFPIKKRFLLKKNSYEAFEKKTLEILSMNKKRYFNYLGKNKNFIMAPSRDFAKKLKRKINSII